MTPFVSVVCPAHNRSSGIGPTVRSVLAQDLADLELVLVLDGCTDDTEQWAVAAADGDARLRLVRTPGAHGHPAGPRNLGLAAARGHVLAYVDHDDVWAPDHLANLVPVLEERGVEAAAAGFTYVDRDGAVTAGSSAENLVWHPEIQVLAPLFEPSRVVHRRGLVERVGGWRRGFGLEDWDLWLRIADSGADFRAHAGRTATLLDDRGTRRHRTARPLRMPAAVFDDPRAARRFVAGLREPDVTGRLREAHAADMAAWTRRISGSARFHAPVRPAGEVPDAGPGAEPAGDAPTYWSDVVILQRGASLEVSFPLWCADRGHADRIRDLVPRVHRGQIEVVAGLVRSHGGTVVLGS